MRNLPLTSVFETDQVAEVMKPVHRYKMWQHLISKGNDGSENADNSISRQNWTESIPFSQWSVPKDAIAAVNKGFVNYTTKVVQVQESARGDTTKLLIQLQDGHLIETVIMQHHHYKTVCLSSQIGCKMGCKFCATGTMGIIGNLTIGEIIEQVVHANNLGKVRNIVFMGMGEPLNNYEAVKAAVEFLVDTRLFSLSPRHVTVSTVGVIKNMRRLTNEHPSVNLALSLHAPNQAVRLKIVPSASAHKYENLIAELDYRINSWNKASDETKSAAVCDDDDHDDQTSLTSTKLTKNFKKHINNAGIMIEYILIKDINDLPEHAEELGAVLKSRREELLLNLIPYNPTDIAEDFEPPSLESIDKFVSILTSEKYRIHTRVRHEKGQDIDGACGQLVVQTNKNSSNSKSKTKDIEDLGTTKGKKKFLKGHRTAAGQNKSLLPTKVTLHGVITAASLGFIALTLFRRRKA